ncbi:hypothetical protein TraAM80_02820 [Trypanosoma rangeli]|uniref:Uncharacterized protein n=1 Tax=Trypanosoma rangeli TaxID=5698 RepID=A0A422NRY9_TRYRA|nr:uncharacterized protein TraAM80_02820 [Trypanosoma rangeli]RNF08247.1 hypothetical protein TraAM80_02820 [Trypanosoma rangeli]|eukprot:RNF08247.1 hypothetical protein TraAM80_02820 [Trypanosoma rangeli]
MLSLNSYNFSNGAAAASFSLPLMDCTSAIHNSDNIQKGASYFSTGKKAATITVMGQLKESMLAIEETQPPGISLKRTNNPYARKLADGTPCVPRSPLSAEMSFMMSYKEVEGKGLNAVLPTSNTPRMVTTVAQNNSNSVQGNAKGNFPSVSRSGTMKQFAFWVPPFKGEVVATPTVVRSNHIGTMSSTPPPIHTATKRVEIWNARNNASAHSTPANTCGSSATRTDSVTHVRCRRVYVNGRPMTVWPKEDEPATGGYA